MLLGDPAQMVSSLICSRSTAGLPKTIAPSLPLPMGSAWFQFSDGASYHSFKSFCCCATTLNPIVNSSNRHIEIIDLLIGMGFMGLSEKAVQLIDFFQSVLRQFFTFCT